MVSNPIIPEEMLKRIRPIVMNNKNTKTGPQSIAAWIREACESKLNPEPDEAEPMPAEMPEVKKIIIVRCKYCWRAATHIEGSNAEPVCEKCCITRGKKKFGKRD